MNRAAARLLLPLLAAAIVSGAHVTAATFAPAPQGKSQEELAKQPDEKMALAVFKKTDWTFGYDAARERARRR